MSEFFKTSATWVVGFRYEGRLRRWFKAFRPGDDVHEQITTQLRQLYGDRALLVEVRKATEDEETQYLRGEEPKSMHCPTGNCAPTGRES
jgi:signal-transduction protein with cAMP-binding, CBS, and nucleotidyltransferase domain